MYHAIVRARVRALWRAVGSGDRGAAVALAAPDLEFRFVGPPPVGAQLRGPAAFEQWFARLDQLLPGLRMTLREICVSGWPWRTTVVVRLDVATTLADGSAYRNEAVQWVTLRWGRMVRDVVFEDTAALVDGLRRQREATAR
jgi:ketosteroid isomerase-like protein